VPPPINSVEPVWYHWGMARPNKKQQDDAKAVVALIIVLVSAGAGLMALIAAAKRYVHHPTYGNAARAFLAALNLAEDLD
jgi:hypothetical protein